MNFGNNLLYFNRTNPLLLKLIFSLGFEFCESYDIDVEKLSELWLTFCYNNDIDIDPTIDTLIKMEYAVLKDYKLHDSNIESHTKQEQSTMEKHFITNEAVYPLILKLIVLTHRRRTLLII